MVAPSGSTALSALTPYQQNYHYTLLGGGVDPGYLADTSPGEHLPHSTGSVLAGGVLDYLDTAIDTGNPFADAASYDPTTDMDNAQNRLDALIEIVDLLDPESDFTSHLAAALAEVDSVFSTTYIDDDVANFETKTAPAFARAINRLTAPLAAAGATNSSAFILGMALLERQRIAELAEYRSQLEGKKSDQRALMIQQFVAEISNSLSRKLNFTQVAAQMQHELSRANIIANKEFIAEELELDYKDLTYELELFGYANSALAAGLGAPMRPLGPSKASTQLSATISTIGTIASAASPLGMLPALALAGAGGALAWNANG